MPQRPAELTRQNKVLTPVEMDRLRDVEPGGGRISIPYDTFLNLLYTIDKLTQLAEEKAEARPPTPAPTVDKQNNSVAAAPPSGDAASFVSKLLADSPMDAPAAWEILTACIELASFLMGKNKAYGNAALDPVRIMSSADPAEQIRVRMDDKLSRLVRGGGAHAAGEDAIKDLVGYYILMQVAERMNK